MARVCATATLFAMVPAANPLSPREREVLSLLAAGHTNREVASLLYISVRTAESHRASIMRKLGLTTRAELVRYAVATGCFEFAAGRVP